MEKFLAKMEKNIVLVQSKLAPDITFREGARTTREDSVQLRMGAGALVVWSPPRGVTGCNKQVRMAVCTGVLVQPCRSGSEQLKFYCASGWISLDRQEG
jgi:hypothetical protein